MKEQYYRTDNGELVNILGLSEQEAKDLYNFLENKVGFISYQLDMPIIHLVRKLRKYYKETNDQNMLIGG